MAVNGDGGDGVVAGRYRIGARLGRGGMGTVWQAEDELLGRQVAVKELHLDEGLSGQEARQLRERTVREARTVAQVAHPNVLTVHDVVEQDGRPWIVMELVDGRSLAQRIEAEGPLEAREAAGVGLALLGALRAAHERGVLHRDLKPANVLLESRTGRVVLMDFGIAQVPGVTTISRTGAFVGSPEYTAPERMEGRPNGEPSDLWSLGVLLCAAVEGRTPFQRDHLAGVLHAVALADISLPDSAAPLRPVVRGLLERDPVSRLGRGEAERLLRAYLDTGRMPTGEPEPLSGPFGTTGPSAVRPDAEAPPASGTGTPPDGTGRGTDGGSGAAPAYWPEAGSTPEAPDGPGPAPEGGSGTPSVPVEPATVPGVPARRAGSGRMRFVAAVLAAGVVGGGVAVAVLLGTGGTGEDRGVPSSSAEPGGRASGGSDEGNRAAPEGYRTVRDPAGFRGAVPEGFTRSYEPPRVFYYSPGKDFRIGVHVQDLEPGGAVAVMRKAHGEGPQRYSGYRGGSVRDAPQNGYPGALWEFTWDGGEKDGGPRHTYDQSWDEAGKMYDVWVSSPERQQAVGKKHFRTLLRTFARVPAR